MGVSDGLVMILVQLFYLLMPLLKVALTKDMECVLRGLADKGKTRLLCGC